MESYREFVETSAEPAVRGFLHAPDHASGDGLVLAHSAGGNCRSPLLVALADAFCASGITVLRVDLPFRQERPQGPPLRSADRDQKGLARAVAVLRQGFSGRVFLGGHSYGGRQASMLCAREQELADGLLLLSYPLHPPKRPNELRTAHFPGLRIPALFVHGRRDGFGTLEEISAALKLIPARTKLLTIPEAGHELLNKTNREALPRLVVETFQKFFAD